MSMGCVAVKTSWHSALWHFTPSVEPGAIQVAFTSGILTGSWPKAFSLSSPKSTNKSTAWPLVALQPCLAHVNWVFPLSVQVGAVYLSLKSWPSAETSTVFVFPSSGLASQVGQVKIFSPASVQFASFVTST